MIPDDLRAARKQFGLTQAELAALLGYGAASRISEIERGWRELSDSARRLLAAYLDGYRPADWPKRERESE